MTNRNANTLTRRRAIAAFAAWAAAGRGETAAADVLNVMDFEPLARAALPPAHFGYIATGVDDDKTVVANHAGFDRYQIRSRRMVDVSQLDTSVTVYGVKWPTPVYLSAVSSMRAFNPEGEIAVARAGRARDTLQMLSTGASAPLEEVIVARDAPIWQQLYPTDDWQVTQGLVRRAQAAGCPAIALTVDIFGARNRETLARAAAVDSRQCNTCHINNNHDMHRKAPLFAGLDVSQVRELLPLNVSWDYFDRLRDIVTVKLILKGIVTREDAALAVAHGADGVVVSNHGGRSEETLRPTIACLGEVVEGTKHRIPVFLDGGVRRGTDVYKALALGATGVGVGRPYAWGLAAFGQPGVEAVIDIYTRELRSIMRHAGTPTIAAITSERVVAG